MGDIAFKTLGGEGPDIVLIHGFGSDRLSWLGNSPALMTLGRVHALDLPGHGDSRLDVADVRPSDLAEAVAAAIRHHTSRPAHLVGHSLGGTLAMMIAALAPETIVSLTLITPAGLGRGIDTSFVSEFPEASDAETAATLLRRLVARPQLINKMTVQRALDLMSRPHAREALRRIGAGLIAEEASFAETATRVAAMGLPRLTLWGAGDAINPLDAERLRDFGGESLIVEDTGHLPHIENPRAVNARMVEFLSSVLAG